MKDRLLQHVGDLAEDSDDVVSAGERYRAHFDGDAVAVVVDEDDGRVGRVQVPEQPAGKELPRAASVLRRDDGRELAAFDVSDEPARSRVHPADHTRLVDEVAGDVDVLERVSDLCLHRLQSGGRHVVNLHS